MPARKPDRPINDLIHAAREGQALSKEETERLARRLSVLEDFVVPELQVLQESNSRRRRGLDKTAITRARQKDINNKIPSLLPEGKKLTETRWSINSIVDKLDNEGWKFADGKSVDKRWLQKFVGRALAFHKLRQLVPTLAPGSRTIEDIVDVLCEGQDRWTYNDPHSIKKETLISHLRAIHRLGFLRR